MPDRAVDPPVLKGFKFVKVLGSGGFSDVFLYEQELPRREVAVKVLLAEGLTPEGRQAFVAEANLMAQLSTHPYIVTIYHADVAADGRPYFIMEYCPGASLSERYKRQPFTVAEALRTGIRVASAVATAHQAEILHRDIKPANVLTNDFGWPALTDFGISSALVDDAPSQTVTRTARAGEGSSTGTAQSVGLSIPWSPPEMFDDVPRPDIRTDVFSLSATIYTLLAGHTPFEVPGGRNQTLDLMGRIERGAITPMKRDDVPRSLLVVLKKGMAVSREDRYPSAVEFARALQRVELELSYAPTTIEVRNLVVPEPERVGGSEEDATRARGVTTVAAQKPTSRPPTRAPAGVAPPAPLSVPVLDATVVRGTRSTTASASAVDDGSGKDGDDEADATRQRRRWPAIVAGVVGVSVVAVAAVAALSSGGEGPTPPTEPTTTVGVVDPLGSEMASAPIGAVWTVGESGATATVSWSNPDPANGDTYVWQRIGEASDTPKIATSEPTATIEGLIPGESLCVEVWTLRGGRLSSDSLRSCYP